MAGLMGGGAGVAPVNFNGEGEEPEPNVSEAEQAEYEMFVRNGLELIYSPTKAEEEGGEQASAPVQQEVLGRLATGEDRIEALAQTTVWLVTMLETSAEANGKKFDGEILYHGGLALLEELAEVASAAKIHDYRQGELQGAFYKALDMYREANADRIDQGALAAEFEALDAADKEGRADEVLPGFNRVEDAFVAAEQDRPIEEEEEAE